MIEHKICFGQSDAVFLFGSGHVKDVYLLSEFFGVVPFMSYRRCKLTSDLNATVSHDMLRIIITEITEFVHCSAEVVRCLHNTVLLSLIYCKTLNRSPRSISCLDAWPVFGTQRLSTS